VNLAEGEKKQETGFDSKNDWQTKTFACPGNASEHSRRDTGRDDQLDEEDQV